MLNKIKYILVTWVVLGVTTSGFAQTKSQTKDTLSIEKQQQFLYYFYEAQRLIQKEEVLPAWELMQFAYELNPNDAAVNNYMGVFLDAFDCPKEAIKYLERAFELEPNEYWYQYSTYLLQSGNKKAEKLAIRNLELVAKDNPKDEELHTHLQKAYIHVQDYKKALALRDKLDTIIGYNTESAMQRYLLNAALNRLDQAIYEVERYLEEDPNDQQFQVFRLKLYEETLQPSEKMVPAYLAVLRFDPRNYVLMNNLAWHLCLLGDLEQAEQFSRTTILAEPSNPVFLDTYAWILYHKGEYQSAFIYIQSAMEKVTPEHKKEALQHYKAILKKLKL